jgi:long-chain fatty acid transport protein
MKNILLVIIGLAAALPRAGYCSGYEFDGVGAAAVARGGAVIADAADWTAIYWNPANLTDVKGREAGLELKTGLMYPKDGNSLNTPVGNPFDKSRESSSFLFGSLGGAVRLNEESALGAGLYLPLLQGSKFKDTAPSPVMYKSIDYEGFAGLAVWNLSYARKFGDKFSAAAGADLIYAQLKSRSTSDFAVSPLLAALLIPGPDVVHQKLDGDGYGLEGVFGLKYAYSGELAFGAVFRTGARVKMEGTAEATSQVLPAEKSDFKFTLKQPATSGIGAAWQARRTLKLSCDLTQTWWKGFSNKTTYETPGLMIRSNDNTYNWKNSFKFRAGAAWARSERTDLLFGYAFDTPALDKGSVDLSTSIDTPMHRFTFGLTRKWDSLRGTLTAMGGYGRRTSGGVEYSLYGFALLGEAAMRF